MKYLAYVFRAQWWEFWRRVGSSGSSCLSSKVRSMDSRTLCLAMIKTMSIAKLGIFDLPLVLLIFTLFSCLLINSCQSLRSFSVPKMRRYETIALFSNLFAEGYLNRRNLPMFSLALLSFSFSFGSFSFSSSSLFLYESKRRGNLPD